jgi:hypothetical protein
MLALGFDGDALDRSRYAGSSQRASGNPISQAGRELSGPLMLCIAPFGGAYLRKPTQRSRQPKKREVLVINAGNQSIVVAALRNAAQTAQYRSSPYHRVTGSRMGTFSVTRRWPHASKCPPQWDREVATRALREAIRAGRVSADWDGNFPRFVWHLEGETLYEARLSNREQGEYHAYPLEDRREWPVNV